MDFTIVDGIVAAIVIVSAILAYSRGFVREALAIGGWILAAVVAYLLAAEAEPLIREVPYLGEYIGESCELGLIAAFAGVFIVALVIVSLFTPMFSGMIQRSAVGGLDAFLGFLFGVARGFLLVLVALIAYDRLAGDERVEVIEESRTIAYFAEYQAEIEAQIPEDAPGWIQERFDDLTASCADPGSLSEPGQTEDGTEIELTPEAGTTDG